MKYLRLPLFLTIWMTGLGIVPLSLTSFAIKTDLFPVLAQGSPTAAKQDTPYNRYMQAGYEATTQKDYANAKDQFKKALAERPEDIYAQQALQNVDIYLVRSTSPLSTGFKNPLWLILGLLAILAGLGTAFWLFFRSLSPRVGKAPLLKSETIAPALTRSDDPAPKDPLPPDASGNAATPEVDLVLQTTTRLPNVDWLDVLLQELRDSNPQKRRKAIWELAQKADSRAMKPLVDLMIDTDSQERSLILEALSQISTRTLKPMNQALAIALQDKNPQVRKNAIRDLTRMYDIMSQISQMLCHSIDDADSEVKETAKWALNQLNLQMPIRLDLTARAPQGSVTVEQSYSESAE